MGNIRKQTIVSSILIYLGFGVGIINTYLFAKLFNPDEYGLTRLFFDIGQLIFAFSSLGIIPVLLKFYPYYKDHLPDKKNDLLGRALLISFIGFVVVCIAGYVFQPLVIRKFSENSKLLVDYYHWVFPFGLGMLAFGLLESYSWALKKTVLPNFLRETALRILTSLLIILYYLKLVSFQHFIFLFSGMWLVVAAILFVTFLAKHEIHLTLKTSRVTKKFGKKMRQMQALIYSGVCVTIIGATIDGIIIASLKGLTQTAIYTFAQYAANLVQVPQRSIKAISTGVLIREWKEKNFAEISRIYQRSCINLLLLALFIFGNVWLNISDGIKVLHIKNDYAAGLDVILIIGIARIIDAGTGINDIIILTSTRWKFDFFSGMVMLGLRLPLTYILIKRFGIIGSAYAELISLTIYNFLRYDFIRRKYKMQPFSIKTIYSILLGVGSYFIVYFSLGNTGGWAGIIARGVAFSGLMIGGIFLLKLTPDAMQLYDSFKRRLSRSAA